MPCSRAIQSNAAVIALSGDRVASVSSRGVSGIPIAVMSASCRVYHRSGEDCELRGAAGQDGEVEVVERRHLVHDLGDLRVRERHSAGVGWQKLLHHLVHRSALDGERQKPDAPIRRQDVRGTLTLTVGAQVDDRPDPELGELKQALLGERRERIGAVEDRGCDRAVLGRKILDPGSVNG